VTAISEVTLVTGGAGYVGAPLVEELLDSGRRVRVLDILLHGQEDVAVDLERRGAEVIRGDVRDADARRAALDGVAEVVHLAAIVGDPACALDPGTAQAVNVDATSAVVQDARAAGVKRFLFASTCSNYGRMADPETPIDEEGELRPISLYAEQKVEIERMLLAQDLDGLEPTCLRFATVYGAAPRMRFDLTVNEFTRDLWSGHELEVFGERFWRPYVHVRDAGRAVRTALDAPPELVARQVFNAGRSGENYRKSDLVDEIRKQLGRGSVKFVHRDEDPRDYKVSFDRIKSVLGFETEMTVPQGIAEIVSGLEHNAFGDPFGSRHRNIP
jgi:nucleoside-diphosphate-sugar epimerase